MKSIKLPQSSEPHLTEEGAATVQRGKSLGLRSHSRSAENWKGRPLLPWALSTLCLSYRWRAQFPWGLPGGSTAWCSTQARVWETGRRRVGCLFEGCSEPQSSPLCSGVENSVCLIRGLCVSIRSKNPLISIVNIRITATLLSLPVLKPWACHGLQEFPKRPANAVPGWKLFLPWLQGM